MSTAILKPTLLLSASLVLLLPIRGLRAELEPAEINDFFSQGKELFRQVGC